VEEAFIDFVLSEEGQNVVEDMGYIKMTGEVTPAPTPKATPTPKVTPTPTPTSTPGFEVVFAIAGLLVIAYVALRRRK